MDANLSRNPFYKDERGRVDDFQGLTVQCRHDLGLTTLAAPELNSLFRDAARLNHDSAWFAHVPFALDRRCWAAARAGRARHPCRNLLRRPLQLSAGFRDWDALLRSRWLRLGDEHVGRYDETVFAELSRYHEQHFAAFSQLLRCTFDEAAEQFENGTIDLLHIDGLHTYEAVRHDFETWLPKLSDRSVVLFHDTNERLRGFGVWRLWDELARDWPSFEFVHGHGLGVLCVGARRP